MISSENMVVLITIGDPFSCLLFSQTESMKRCQTCGQQRTQTELQCRRERDRERERERAGKCEDLNDSSTPYKLEIMMKTIKNWKYHFLVVCIGKPGLVLARSPGLLMNTTKKCMIYKTTSFAFQNKYQWKMVSFCFIFNIRKSILCCIFSKF